MAIRVGKGTPKSLKQLLGAFKAFLGALPKERKDD